MAKHFSNYYYSDLLKLCCETHNQSLLKKLHCHIIRNTSNPETHLFNRLIDTYGKLRNLRYARLLFDEMPQPNLVSWNTILCVYSKSGRLIEMREVFDRMPSHDGVSWNVLISGYSSSGSVKNSVEAYCSMLREGVSNVNRITLQTVISMASASEGCVEFGRQIHGQVVKFGFEFYSFVCSPLVNMYSKAGFVHEAKRVFEESPEKSIVVCNTMLSGLLRGGLVVEAQRLFRAMPEKDSISWTSIITGLTKNSLFEEAIGEFREMGRCGLEMDQFTFGSILTACAGLSGLEQGKQIHGFIVRNFGKNNVFVGSALVDMYCKCKNLKYAASVLERMEQRNVVSWTSLVVGFGQNGLGEEALRIFREMERNGVESDNYTLGSVISSCANLASLEEGAQFHARAINSGLFSFITVSNALVTLYGKCGSIAEAHKIFDELRTRDEVSWTALVTGYSQFGKANETIELFEKMLSEGFKPDGVTFIGVISACSRSGLVEKGRWYFESMVRDHKIAPISDHYTCMIDLLSRGGRLEEAREFIAKMPQKPDAAGWITLLSSCRSSRNLEIGKWAAESLLELDPQNPASYVLLASIYASKGNWDKVAELRRGMKEKGLKKEPGCSWIKHKGIVHIFTADDRTSQFSDQIYTELDKLHEKMFKEGYEPDMSFALQDIEESEKRKLLSYHSERLAIAFGLIFVPVGLPIRVVKNLRVCGDCHNATKYISKITQREILVRDSVRYHLFKDGSCSCDDFW